MSHGDGTYCRYCDITVDESHWIRWPSNPYRRCSVRVKGYSRDGNARARSKEDYWLRSKYDSYKKRDKANSHPDTLTYQECKLLVQQACHYCGYIGQIGIDRIDNGIGHTFQNSRPCCSECNMILGALPVEIKDCLAAGLREARNQGLLDSYIVPFSSNSRKKY